MLRNVNQTSYDNKYTLHAEKISQKEVRVQIEL